ncbi:MAG: hypothetical protein DI547_01660 [Sphingobium sp.]|nr:MAG: hypothetical protein DI547_01660 [Sphingobium sp.]
MGGGQGNSAGLRDYYSIRAIVAAAWVVAAFSVGQASWTAAVLLVAYPAWDAIANLFDARRSGGLARNTTQTLNVVASAATALAVAAFAGDTHAVLAVFGIWAIVAGLLQLATGVRRWKSFGAQWAMILSGGQSALAGGFMIQRSLGTAMPGIADVASYAAFGAFYFLVSAILLTVRARR